MRKKILFAVMALLTMATGNVLAQDVPYVVFNNGTLYFTCRESADLTEIIIDGETVKLNPDDGSTKNCWRGTEVTSTGSSGPGWNGYSFDITNVVIDESFKKANITNCSGWFRGCRYLTSLELSNLNTSNVTCMDYMFYDCNWLTSLDLSSFDTSNVTSMDEIFNGCSDLTLLDLSSFDTSNVTSMSSMFRGCSDLTSLDLSNFNTSNVTDMSAMFSDCSNLASLDLSSFNISNVQDMDLMFWGCNSLTSLGLSSFKTSNVTGMKKMFYGCSSLTSLDLSSFDTSNVTSMLSMFEGCSSLTSLDLSNFNTSNVTDMVAMFKGCSNLASLDLSSFKTSNVPDMGFMFYGCSSLTSLDLSSFNTSNVIKMSGMFMYCSSLTSLDICNFNTSYVISDKMQNIFYKCPSLRLVDLSQATIPNFSDLEGYVDYRTLIYVPEGTIVSEDRENVVVGKDCEHFVIGNDQLLLRLPYGFTAKKITVNRDFTAERLYTLCLPFAMDAKAYGTFYAYKEYNENDKGVTFNALDGMAATTANSPYLFMPTETLENGIVIDTPTEIAKCTEDTSDDGEFIGIYKEKTFTEEEGNEGVYYVWSDYEFVRVDWYSCVDACCACLRLPASSVNSAPQRLSVQLGGSGTGISTAVSGADGDTNAPVYNLQGQRVGSSYKGVMIRNGKKMIMK